jgi:hypothetical protein
MMTKRFLALAAACPLILLAACGGGDGVPLGEFPAMTKTEGDAPFELKAPTSKSPAAFSFESSDTKVATINGNVVTVLAAGFTTITARQGSLGSYNPTSTSALLTVKERTCVAGVVRNKSGLCVPPGRSELKELATSAALAGQGWALGDTWSATAGTATTHSAVDTTSGTIGSLMSDNKLYVTCTLSQSERFRSPPSAAATGSCG